ncbi:carbohydrate ABC transporter permease [Nocardiopsis nanhaiensis]
MSTPTTAPATAPQRPPGQRPRGWRALSRRTRAGVIGWGFALPFVLLFAAFTAGPVLMSLLMSFTDMRAADLRTPWAVELAGLDNFARLLGDDKFLRSMANTLAFVLVGVPLTIGVALAIALALDRGITRFRTFFRTGFYLPVVTSIVAVAVVWRFLLHPDTGLVNTALATVGIPGIDWLSNTVTALPVLIVMAVWRNFGTLMVIFLAGLQGIPRNLYEAAEIDGAGPWQRLRSITLPMMRPIILFGAVITGIGFLQVFEEPFVMTQGGPLDATRTVSYHIYTQFGFGNYAYAAAMSYVLFVCIIALTVLQFRLLRSRT